MRCNTCGEYIYKGRKFNARKETVPEEYLGIRIFRFYIRCPQCAAEITYRTDPKNADYAAEHGAKRNFEPWREEKEEAEKARQRRELEEQFDPMKRLENKTYDSKRELDIVEALDEIRTMNARMERVDTDAVFDRIVNEGSIITQPIEEDPLMEEGEEEEEDEAIIRKAFSKVQQQEEIAEQVRIRESILNTNVDQTKAKESLLGTGLDNQVMTTKKKLDPSTLGVVLKKRPRT
jgi:hypothetical protein